MKMKLMALTYLWQAGNQLMPLRRKDLFTTHNRVKIIRGGAEYFRLVVEIADSAEYFLHLQTYIFDEDETGNYVADALIRAVQRKVRVYVLLDGYASQHLSAAFISRLQAAGINFSFFEPLYKSRHFYFGRRLHHKVVVADARISMVAGINVSNRYNDLGETHAWLDWAVYDEGEVAAQLHTICTQLWNRSVFRKKIKKYTIPRAAGPVDTCLVRIRRNDWVYRKTQITRSYREMFVYARSHVTVMTSYFWPPQKLLRRMAIASARGVKIKLILTAKADVPFAKYAERYLYRWLLRHNIEVYEYQDNILHGKVAVRDNEFVTAGSYNVNNISAYASVELNLDIKDPEIAAKVNDNFEHIIRTNCVQIDKANFWTSKSWRTRLSFYLSYRIVHLIFFLFTFYFIQRRDND